MPSSLSIPKYAPSPPSRPADLPVGERALPLSGARLGLGLDDDHAAPGIGARQWQRVGLEVGAALVAADAPLQGDDDVGPLAGRRWGQLLARGSGERRGRRRDL